MRMVSKGKPGKHAEGHVSIALSQGQSFYEVWNLPSWKLTWKVSESGNTFRKTWVPTTDSRVELIQCEASLSGESLQNFCGVLSVQKVGGAGEMWHALTKALELVQSILYTSMLLSKYGIHSLFWPQRDNHGSSCFCISSPSKFSGLYHQFFSQAIWHHNFFQWCE